MLPFAMFDDVRTGEEARRAEKLTRIYHQGQAAAWDGRKVLAELIAKHGGVDMPPHYLQPLSKIFSILMWGELAAWKISAQLADVLVSLEPKMAATSQVFDEARHFYVLHDYLVALGRVPSRPDRHTQAALDLVLGTRSVVEKLIGMQMMFEPTALTIFKLVREQRFEPVLADLLVYFERDEARHIGLGVQTLPELMSHLWPHERARLAAFQFRLIGHILRSLRHIEPELRVLGVDARDVLEAGVLKHQFYTRPIIDQLGFEARALQEVAQRSVIAVCELMFPRGERSARARLRKAASVIRYGSDFLKAA
jgi:hypothetical protein